MLDYCLFVSLFQNELESYCIYGKYQELHPKILNLIEAKNIKQSDNPEFVLIYKESRQFVDFYWKNILKDNVKWLFIYLKTMEEANVLFREIRNFGETYLDTNEPMVILKNINIDFQLNYRNEFIKPIEQMSIDEFLDIKILESVSDCEQIIHDKPSQLIKSLSSNSLYVYFGKTIDTKDLLKCQMLAKMKFFICECTNEQDEICGYFANTDFIEKLWLYLLSGNEQQAIVNLYKLNEIKIKVPVRCV